MVTTFYPDEQSVRESIRLKEPLLMMVSFDGESVIVGTLDESVEHHVLLAKVGISSGAIDRYFRIVLDENGADWTFVCPPDYKNIKDKSKRITAFYKDGFSVIANVLQEFGFLVGINIPKRYQRHIQAMSDEK
jgi:hypothetical protein